jgi:uncharacterized protein YndB with AHSA1/START domain
VFQFGATSRPEHVWSVLTTSQSTRRFLFGVGLESTWEIGSRITGHLDRAPVMHGEVLFAEYPNRLTYLLAAGPEQPEVYVTWEVRECGAGAIVRLSVDEADTASEEVEAAWQPVVTKLRASLSAS